MVKNSGKKEKDSVFYLKRMRVIGIVGIVISLILVGVDIYTFEKGWLSILSFIVDGLLFLFSIYFIVKGTKLIALTSILKESKEKKNKK